MDVIVSGMSKVNYGVVGIWDDTKTGLSMRGIGVRRATVGSGGGFG